MELENAVQGSEAGGAWTGLSPARPREKHSTVTPKTPNCP